MLGLNLNTSMPFSPLTEITYSAPNPEEEVDAVTGKKDDIDLDAHKEIKAGTECEYFT